jgi:hypothetical protein
MAMHQPLDPSAADESPFRAQGRVDARGAIAATVAGLDTPDSRQKRPGSPADLEFSQRPRQPY